MNILFVCTGNINRSSAAEIFTKAIVSEGSDYSVDSAGVSDYNEGRPMNKRMQETVVNMGYDLPDEMMRSKPVTRELLDWADWVLCMQPRHQLQIIKDFGEDVKSKLGLLSEDGIKDPHRKDRETYRRVAEKIEHRCEALFKVP